MEFSEKIISILEKNNIHPIVIVISLAFIYLFTQSKIFIDFLGNILTKISNKFMSKKISTDTYMREITEEDIKEHEIFTLIEFWINSKVPSMTFSSEYRTAVFRRYLTVCLRTYKDNIKDFIDDMGKDKVEKMDVLELINKTVMEYERELLNMGIPMIIIEKMKVKRNGTIDLTINLVDAIYVNRFINSESNLLKTYYILNIISIIVENTVNCSEEVCNSINGALAGLTFEGKVEPHHD